jgi:hypothetical protein
LVRAAAGEIRGDEGSNTSRGKTESFSRPGREDRLGTSRPLAPQLDHPTTVRKPLAEVQLHRCTIVQRRGQGGVERGTRVHDQEVAGLEVLGKTGKPGMGDGVVFPMRHEKTHLVALPAARLDRLVCLE